MTTRIAVAALVAALVVTPGLTLADDDAPALEALVAEMAQTPEQHRALADYYRSKAEDARAEARRHEQMGRTYGSPKLALRQKMQRHCKEISSKQAGVAEEYAALAKLHEQEAKQM